MYSHPQNLSYYHILTVLLITNNHLFTSNINLMHIVQGHGQSVRSTNLKTHKLIGSLSQQRNCGPTVQ